MEYKIISNYQKNDALRHSFNELSKKVFGLDFENWYQNGFWNDNYIPYSILIDNKIISNVSVNICNFSFKGQEIHLIQIGTVMTDPEFRGKGLAKILLKKVLSEYENKIDGIYLFANDSVSDFYPKFGFRAQKEYQYSKEVFSNSQRTIVPVAMNTKTDWIKMVDIIKNKSPKSQFYMSNNTDLYMFYLSQFMQENVFYIKEKDSYIIAEEDEKVLKIHAIFGNCEINDVISAFGSEVKKAILCYSPECQGDFVLSELHEEDTTLFVRGKFFENMENAKLMFPSLSHA